MAGHGQTQTGEVYWWAYHSLQLLCVWMLCVCVWIRVCVCVCVSMCVCVRTPLAMAWIRAGRPHCAWPMSSSLRSPGSETGTLQMASSWACGPSSCWCSSRPTASSTSSTSSEAWGGPVPGVLAPCFVAPGRHFLYSSHREGWWFCPVESGDVGAL